MARYEVASTSTLVMTQAFARSRKGEHQNRLPEEERFGLRRALLRFEDATDVPFSAPPPWETRALGARVLARLARHIEGC